MYQVAGIQLQILDLVLCGNKEWSINNKIIQIIFKIFEKPKVERFTIRLNTKYSKYVSYKPHFQ